MKTWSCRHDHLDIPYEMGGKEIRGIGMNGE